MLSGLPRHSIKLRKHSVRFDTIVSVTAVVRLFTPRNPPSRLLACSLVSHQAVGIELDLSAIASAAVNAARNGLKMDTYYPHEVRVVHDASGMG